MYIIDDICYAGTPEDDMEVIHADPLPGRMLLVTFSTGETRLYDTTLLTGPVFDALNDEKIFRDISTENGFISWMNGDIDVATETVYADSYPYETKTISQLA